MIRQPDQTAYIVQKVLGFQLGDRVPPFYASFLLLSNIT